MRVAVTYEDGKIFQHFGRTQYFKVYDIKDGEIINSKVISTNGKGHGALGEVLEDLGINVLICGGIGLGAQIGLQDIGIILFGGHSGDCDKIVSEYVKGTLEYNLNIVCNHQDHYHEDGHRCEGNHSCMGR